MNYIPYGRQDINEQDIQSVVNVLKSDFLTQGPEVPNFEELISQNCNSKHAIVFNSATSALHIACLSLGVTKGDYVWTSPISFVASSNCALYCGANIDFVDIDSQTYNLCPIELEKKLLIAKKENKLPKVLIPVHLAGQSCDMKKIFSLSKEYNFKIIEDASHAIGGNYLKQPVGGCQYSDITIFSFHPVKIITSAEGGAATTNNLHLASQMKLLRSHGVTRDSSVLKNQSHGPWYYEQIDLGYNYRMTELQAALGTSQLRRLNEFILKRTELASYYNEELSGLPLQIPLQSSDTDSAWHLYIIRLDLSSTKFTHKETFIKLTESNIGVNLHYMPIYKQPYYKNHFNFEDGYCPNAENYYKEAISIPMFSSITKADAKRVCETLRRIL